MTLKEIFTNLWAKMCEFYGYYSAAIHKILPGDVGNLAEAVLDIAIACLIVKIVADIAFSTKNNG